MYMYTSIYIYVLNTWIFLYVIPGEIGTEFRVEIQNN